MKYNNFWVFFCHVNTYASLRTAERQAHGYRSWRRRCCWWCGQADEQGLNKGVSVKSTAGGVKATAWEGAGLKEEGEKQTSTFCTNNNKHLWHNSVILTTYVAQQYLSVYGCVYLYLGVCKWVCLAGIYDNTCAMSNNHQSSGKLSGQRDGHEMCLPTWKYTYIIPGAQVTHEPI